MLQLTPRLGLEPVEPDDETALREWFDLEVVAKAVDHPANPPRCWQEHRVSLTVPWPGEQTHLWLARHGDVLVGRAELGLPMLDNLDNAFADVLVAPDHRRTGIGRALLDHLVAEARHHGRVRLIGQVHQGTDGHSPGSAFAATAGATRALAETRRRLALPADADALARLGEAARKAADGFDLVQWTGPTPHRWLDDIAVLKGRMSTDAPFDDLHLGPEDIDAARILDRDAARHARGQHVVVTAARAAERLVAFTEIVVRATVGHHGGQGDTIAAPEHRGHRLGTLVKLANLELARYEHPTLRMIDTWNADSNPYMVSINEALGFRPLERWAGWELAL